MVVKVMVAPTILRSKDLSAGKANDASAQPKPRRRRSAVFDADGNEVFITLMCLKCHKMRPLSQFGLRKMADGAIRNQPWCRSCRSGSTAEKPRRSKAVAPPASQPAGEPARSDSPPTAGAQRPASAGSVAAQVAAALAAGYNR
jgi:hypothetical protein